jgi:hypothetical protein
MVWMGIASEMDPTAWEWKQKMDELIPIMADKNAAPVELLKIIHCTCSGECKSARCSCKRYMDSPALLLVDHFMFKTVTIQTTLQRLIQKKRRKIMTFKTGLLFNT